MTNDTKTLVNKINSLPYEERIEFLKAVADNDKSFVIVFEHQKKETRSRWSKLADDIKSDPYVKSSEAVEVGNVMREASSEFREGFNF